MSIKTTGQLQGEDLKTVATAAGFVKNDASGNFLFGQTGSAWTFLETKTLASAATVITFSGLVAGAHAWRLVWENPFDVGTPAVTDGRLYFRRNSSATPISNTGSVITEVLGTGGALTFSTNTAEHVISNMITPSGAFPFVNSGIFEYTFTQITSFSENVSGKCSYAKEVNVYPGIPQADGRWIAGCEGNNGGTFTSFDVRAAQTDMLRPGSVWSLYQIDSTP